jgi:hypothetical protein
VEQLTDWGLPWQTIVVSFVIKDSAKRWAALRQEAGEDLGCEDFRRKMRNKFKLSHSGGRRPINPINHGPDVALRDLLSLGQQWLRYYKHAWLEKNRTTFDTITASKLTGYELVSLEHLENSLAPALQNLLVMQESCAVLRKAISGLRKQVVAARRRNAGQSTSS